MLLVSCRGATGGPRYEEDGTWTGRQELQRWYINRAGYRPEKEADRLGLVNSTSGGTPGYDICEDVDGVNNFGTTTNDWLPWLTERRPLAPNAMITTAAVKHAEDCGTHWLSHNSPSSDFYPVGTPFSLRWEMEGYSNRVGGGENLTWQAAGGWEVFPENGQSPSDVHDGLFRDATDETRIHRKVILGNLGREYRETGLGHYRYQWKDGSIWWTKDTDCQDFSSRIGMHFFTGTIFFDADEDGKYGENEGVGGIEVHLWNGPTEAGWYDVSQDCGSFAVPIADLPGGSSILVQIVNTNATTERITVPLDFDILGEIELSPGEIHNYGHYTQPATVLNVGFRNTHPVMRNSDVAVTAGGTDFSVTFSGPARVTYDIQSSENLLTTNWVTFETVVATNERITVTDTGQGAGRNAPGAVDQRFYRILLKKD